MAAHDHSCRFFPACADDGFGSVFGAWDLFFTLDDARAAARSLLKNAADPTPSAVPRAR